MGRNDNDWKQRLGMVYSTNPDFKFESEAEQDVESVPAANQKLRVSVEKHGHGGKTVTIVRGFIGLDDELKELARALKTFCGTGGAVKDGEILIQGDLKEKVVSRLIDNGYRNTK